MDEKDYGFQMRYFTARATTIALDLFLLLPLV